MPLTLDGGLYTLVYMAYRVLGPDGVVFHEETTINLMVRGLPAISSGSVKPKNQITCFEEH
jgi:hypothetical protein